MHQAVLAFSATWGIVCEGFLVWELQDPEGFVENGGWDFLDAEGGDDDEDGDESEEEGRFPSASLIPSEFKKEASTATSALSTGLD